jgi:hypothetical protein
MDNDDSWVLLQDEAPSPRAAPSSAAPAFSSPVPVPPVPITAAPAPAVPALPSAPAPSAADLALIASLRAELAQTRAQLTQSEQRTFAAEQRVLASEAEVRRLTALSASQRHTISQLANQLSLVSAANAAHPSGAVSPTALIAASAEPVALVPSHPTQKVALRAMRRNAKSSKFQFKNKVMTDYSEIESSHTRSHTCPSPITHSPSVFCLVCVRAGCRVTARTPSLRSRLRRVGQ